MFFYLMVIPPMLMSIYALFRLIKMQKHDRVLFRFCQIRREAITLLRDRGDELSFSDYVVLRELLDTLSNTIHHYVALKKTLFNYRRLKTYLKEFRDSAETVESLNKPDDRAIVKLERDMRFALLMSFFAYTPFIKSEIRMRISFWLLKKITKSGVDKYITMLNGMYNYFDWLVGWSSSSNQLAIAG